MQNGYLPAWITEASSVPSKVEVLFEGITEEQLNKKPAPDRWSIGELVDHIIVSNELYFPALERVASGIHKNPLLGRFNSIHSFFGNSILKAVEPETKKKYKTVKKFQPVKHFYSLGKLDEFIDHQQQLIGYAKATDFVDHTQTIISSPATPLIIYSLENALRIILSHEFRHIYQALELKEHLNINIKQTDLNRL